MSLDLYTLASRLVGEVREVPGAAADPFILWCHSTTTLKATSDEVAWCSSLINGLAKLCGLARTKSAAARSWLHVGIPVPLRDAQPGDVVILKRGSGVQPGPEVTDAPGHVTLFAAWPTAVTASHVQPPSAIPDHFAGLGGNQGNALTIANFRTANILGIRRLTPA